MYNKSKNSFVITLYKTYNLNYQLLLVTLSINSIGTNRGTNRVQYQSNC